MCFLYAICLPHRPNSNPLFSSRVLHRCGLEPDESCPNHVRIGLSCSDELLLAIIERFGGAYMLSPLLSQVPRPLQRDLLCSSPCHRNSSFRWAFSKSLFEILLFGVSVGPIGCLGWLILGRTARRAPPTQSIKYPSATQHFLKKIVSITTRLHNFDNKMPYKPFHQ